MHRDGLRRIGVDLPGAVVQAGNFTFTKVIQNAFPVTSPLVPAAQALAAGVPPVAAAGAAVQPTWASNGDSVTAMIQALERSGVFKTLAEPTLTAISGEAANFLAGGEFPVPVSRDRDGNVTIQFKPFGVGLGFTPVVLDEGRISLRISTEVSELTTDGAFTSQGGRYTDSDGNIVIVSGITIPGLRVRRAETTVELPSGGSLVMAGLLQESTKQNIDGLPGVKDLPVLGPLFRSRDFQNNETELVIIVTPYLVKPVAEKELALPTDGFAPASDAETILLGHLNLVYGDGTKTQPEGRLQGPVGFIME